MLVLTRKVGEGIAIGDDIKIVVMQVKGRQVRLGIKASPKTVVYREEVYQKIHQENRDASEVPVDALLGWEQVFGGKKTTPESSSPPPPSPRHDSTPKVITRTRRTVRIKSHAPPSSPPSEEDNEDE